MTQIITEVFIDDLTGLTFAEDVRGYWYLIPDSTSVSTNEFYLHSMVIDPIWANTNSFQPLPTPLISNITNDSYVKFILASQDFKNAYGVSLVGIFVNNVLELALPFIDNLNYKLDVPILVPANVDLEIKFWPFNKKANLGLTIGCYTTD